MDNQFFKIEKSLITQIVSKKEEYLKEEIIKYAQVKSKEIGKEIEVLFLDKEIVDKIIELGIESYKKLNLGEK